MKQYIKPTMEITNLRPEESIATGACKFKRRWFAFHRGCRKHKIEFSTTSV